MSAEGRPFLRTYFPWLYHWRMGRLYYLFVFYLGAAPLWIGYDLAAPKHWIGLVVAYLLEALIGGAIARIRRQPFWLGVMLTSMTTPPIGYTILVLFMNGQDPPADEKRP